MLLSLDSAMLTVSRLDYVMMNLSNITNTRSLGCSVPLLLGPAEGLGALWALLGAFGPLLNSSIQVLITKIGHFQIKALSYKSCRNVNFVCESCRASP